MRALGITLFRRARALRRSAISALLCLGLALPIVPLHAMAQRSPSAAASASEASSAEKLARSLGQAQSALVDWVLDHSGPLTGNAFAGDYRLAYTITPAEAWWDKAGDGELAWHDAPADNVHLRVFIMDRADGRLVPDLNLRVTLIDSHGNRQPVAVAYGWYPLVNAYGGNVPIDTDGRYTIRVAIVANPALALHAPHTPPLTYSPDQHLSQITVAEFPPVEISRSEVARLPLATATAAAAEHNLLKPFNAALSRAMTAWWKQSASGAEKATGDYFVAYALADPAQFGARLKNFLDFSSKDNASLAVLVLDSRTGRMVAGLHPRVTLTGSDGVKTVGPDVLAAAWHPWLPLYSRTLRIRSKKSYRLQVSFDAPGFRRWGKQSQRFGAAAEIDFDHVRLKPGNESRGRAAEGKPTP